MTLALILVGGGLGAVLRWSTTEFALRVTGSSAVGTATVNTIGSFLLGFIVGLGSAMRNEVLTVGLAGGLTTFSTWMVEVEAQQTRRQRAAITLVPLLFGVAAAWVGFVIGSR